MEAYAGRDKLTLVTRGSCWRPPHGGGEAYMLAGGVPEHVTGRHQPMAAAAIEMLEYERSRPVAEAPGLAARIGIHSGPSSRA